MNQRSINLTVVMLLLSSGRLVASEVFHLGDFLVAEGGVSADGLSVYGATISPSTRASVWTEQSGIQKLELGQFGSWAWGTSADAALVAGAVWPMEFEPAQPYVWSQKTGMVNVELPEGSFGGSLGPLSSNGSVGAGSVTLTLDEFGRADEFQASRWTAEGGIQVLGTLPGYTTSSADFGGISADGNIIVGQASTSNDFGDRVSEALIGP